MQATDLYLHKHFGHIAQVTQTGGRWVEFLEGGQLRWLEEQVFTQAYQYFRDGDPINQNLTELRQQARARGLLIPREIQAT